MLKKTNSMTPNIKTFGKFLFENYPWALNPMVRTGSGYIVIESTYRMDGRESLLSNSQGDIKFEKKKFVGNEILLITFKDYINGDDKVYFGPEGETKDQQVARLKSHPKSFYLYGGAVFWPNGSFSCLDDAYENAKRVTDGRGLGEFYKKLSELICLPPQYNLKESR